MIVSQEPQTCAQGSLAPAVLFSIIIPVLNDEQHITRCLTSLTQIQFIRDAFEVIVVDNGSTDHTLQIVSEFQKRLSVRVLERPNVYISAVRNCGASVAKGRYFAFLDSDCEVRSDWLSQAWEAVNSGLNGVFGSHYLIPEGSSWIARCWYEERDKKDEGTTSYLPAGNLFVSRNLFQAVQGFDESIQTNEDYEFCQRVRVAGYSIMCFPALGVIHWGTPQSLAQFYRKHRWHGMHVFHVFFRNLPMLSNTKPVLFSIYTFASLIGVILGIVLLLASGRANGLLASVVALLIPPLALSIAQLRKDKQWNRVLPLFVLHLTYGIARATALLDIHGVRRSSRPREKEMAYVEPNT